MDNEEEYVEPGFYRLFSGAGGVVVGVLISLFVFLCSQFYDNNTNIGLIASDITQSTIAIVITFIEVCIIYHIRNRKKDLAKFSKSEFDSAQGCSFFIFLTFSAIYFNSILFCELNGRFDFRESSKRKVKIINKFRSGKVRSNSLASYRYYYTIEDWNNNGSKFDLRVPESVYGKFNTNNIIEFETKPGLLGFEHLASEITLSK